MKQTTLFALAAASSFACVSASAAIQAFNDDFSTKSTRWNDSNEAVTVADGVASIDADTEVPYYTTYEGTAGGSAVVTKLEFQVAFTAASAAPDFATGAQFQLYLDSSGNVIAMTSDGSTTNSTTVGTATAGALTSVVIDTTTTGFNVTVGNGTTYLVEKASPAPFQSVGFLGTGTVDNFVGSYGTASTTDGSSTADGSALVSGNTVTGSFATTDLKFIKVTTTQGTYTLRYVNGQTIELPSNAGTVESVVAYYGNSVSAIPDNYEAEAVVSQVADDSGKVGVSVVAESGLYYSLKAGNTVVAKKLVAPAEQGSTISLTFDPADVASQTDWGKTTITFQATDDDPDTVAAGE